MKTKCYNIPTINESLRNKVQHGEMTVWGAACEFARHGWSTFVDEEMTRELLGTVRPKTYYIMHNVGRVKYLINFHDGITGHKDGSPFYHVACFNNKKRLAEMVKRLVADGYTEERAGRS